MKLMAPNDYNDLLSLLPFPSSSSTLSSLQMSPLLLLLLSLQMSSLLLLLSSLQMSPLLLSSLKMSSLLLLLSSLLMSSLLLLLSLLQMLLLRKSLQIFKEPKRQESDENLNAACEVFCGFGGL